MSRKQLIFAHSENRLGNRYELLDCLGDGSHGSVWRAQRLSDGMIVAVKIPREQGAKSEDLAEGSRLIGQPSHPNVVGVYWMGRVPPSMEWYAIEMEYFPSVTLAHLLEGGDQGLVASYDRLFRYYHLILQGVNHLHSLGMCHGDIKPHNILISGEDLKLTDFGCSVLPEDMYTRARENGGTILYSAPEIVGSAAKERNSSLLFQADIYSLGVLLYHLVTNRLPHDTLSQVARHSPFPRPREINHSVSPAIEEFILRCLEVSPSQRWASVAEMLPAFQKAWKYQTDYQPIRVLPKKQMPTEDWSSQALRLLSENAFSQAENVAFSEFEMTRDTQAFLIMVKAAFRDQRYFECIHFFQSNQDQLDQSSPLFAELLRYYLDALIETRQIREAERIILDCLKVEGEKPSLQLKHASLLAVQGRYQEACEVLIKLNRELPQRPEILKRLVMIYEQLRDLGKAASFLKAYRKLLPEDRWARVKFEKFESLGMR